MLSTLGTAMMSSAKIPSRVGTDQILYDFVRIVGRFKNGNNYISIA
jgi:hypothetical protein